MEIANSSSIKKPTLTPKAIIYQKYGNKAIYTIQEVEEPPQNGGCPGFVIPQKGLTLFRCFLQLPEFSLVSQPCKKKKEAEQSAAQMALLQLGIDSQSSTPADPFDELLSRLSYVFSDEFLSSLHPFSGHLKAVLRRQGGLSGLLPLSVLIACDAKIGSLCKTIDPLVEANPLLSMPILKKAAVRLSESIVVSEEEFWIKKKNPYPADLLFSVLNQQSDLTNRTVVEAVFIPLSLDKDVVSLSMNLCPETYYLDVIAQQLGGVDASKVLISRTIGKASSEMRLYSSVLEGQNLSADSSSIDGSVNLRASYLLGQHIYGNVILASVGYTWRGADLYQEDISVRSYFRMLIGKTPDGLYKLSRDAILVADLPAVYTTKTNWRGSLPRDLLCGFCRLHKLSEPVFTVVSNSLKSYKGSLKSCTKLAAGGIDTGIISENGGALPPDDQMLPEVEAFRCEIKLFTKNQNLILKCSPEESFKKQGDAVQNASLRVLLWFNMYFKQLLPVECPSLPGVNPNINGIVTSFKKEFVLCPLINNIQQPTDMNESRKRDRNHMDSQNGRTCSVNNHLSMEGTLSGLSASNGSLVCISFTVFLVSEESEIREVLERSDEFEFEIGTGAVNSHIETAVLQMATGQSICFYEDLPPKELIFAAASDYQNVIPIISSKPCRLEYTISILRVTEPYEDRMEQALFSPPLSKQRLEFAMQRIEEFSAANLVDFGCGSGSLLESLASVPSSLEKIVGVDLSQKGLVRAAKVLNSKLEKLKVMIPTSRINSVTLYEGSITAFDSRLFGFDIGTCLEVIEHMEEEEACLFGDVALGLFRPKLLIVSTPNYEYNVILQKSNLAMQEDDHEGTEPQSCKFRNHDHKFEWTREQFNQWASGLALKYNYSVEFGGVGGDGAEPGFASQIAVFRRDGDQLVKSSELNMKVDNHYKTLWEWDASTIVSS